MRINSILAVLIMEYYIAVLFFFALAGQVPIDFLGKVKFQPVVTQSTYFQMIRVWTSWKGTGLEQSCPPMTTRERDRDFRS